MQNYIFEFSYLDIQLFSHLFLDIPSFSYSLQTGLQLTDKTVDR